MSYNLTDLTHQSENGNEIAQIKLFFKQYYDYCDIQAAAATCDKWRENNLFLEGVWTYYGFKKPSPTHMCYREYPPIDKFDCLEIFTQFTDREDEIKYYAYNMMGVCFENDNSLSVKYMKLSAEHGLEYANTNLGSNAGDTKSKIYHYEIAASKYNRRALLELTEIYLTDVEHLNPTLAIKCYQNAMDCGYNLGNIHTLLKIEKYDINMTIKLLEYEANRKKEEAITILANLYANNNNVGNPVLALDWYTRAKDINDTGYKNIHKILKTGKIDWLPRHHSLWPILKIEVVQKYGFGTKQKKSTLLATSFQQQVVFLLFITKYRHLSCFSFTKLMYKNIMLAIITQLAKIWLADAMID